MYRFLWPLRLGWLLVCCLYKDVCLQILNVCPFDYTAVAWSGKVGPVKQVNHTSWVALVTQTDRPKSVRNRCVIKHFCCVVCVVTLPFSRFCWCRGFCHRAESDLFLFLLVYFFSSLRYKNDQVIFYTPFTSSKAAKNLAHVLILISLITSLGKSIWLCSAIISFADLLSMKFGFIVCQFYLICSLFYFWTGVLHFWGVVSSLLYLKIR